MPSGSKVVESLVTEMSTVRGN